MLMNLIPKKMGMCGNLNLVSSHSYTAPEKNQTLKTQNQTVSFFPSEVGAVPFVQVKSGEVELRDGNVG